YRMLALEDLVDKLGNEGGALFVTMEVAACEAQHETRQNLANFSPRPVPAGILFDFFVPAPHTHSAARTTAEEFSAIVVHVFHYTPFRKGLKPRGAPKLFCSRQPHKTLSYLHETRRRGRWCNGCRRGSSRGRGFRLLSPFVEDKTLFCLIASRTH